MPNKDPLVFTTRSYRYLGERMAERGLELGQTHVREFPDGERYIRMECQFDARHVVVVGGTISDPDTLELYDLASELANEARSLTILIPYFGYSTMERRVRRGEVVTAKTRARLLSSIPSADYGNHVLFFDLHTAGLPHYLEGGVRHAHVYGRPVVKKLIAKLGGDDYVVASADSGRADWVESLANDLGVGVSFVYKKRLGDYSTEVTAVRAMVENKTVVIYDDMIRTGTSLLHAAEAYLMAGAREVAAVATHGVLPGEALQKLKASGLFTRIAVTDSHPRAVELQDDDFLHVETAAGLFVDYLRGEVKGW